jgi:hypothetical protein
MLSRQINIVVDERFKKSKMYLILRQEQAEIDKLKWIESEKEGRDIGRIRAVFLWTRYYRKKWLKKFNE